jgi:hypothetical protein
MTETLQPTGCSPELVRDWLRESGLNPKEIEQKKDDEWITWKATSEWGFVILISVYRVGLDIFLRHEVAIAKVPESKLGDVSRFLITSHYNWHVPVRLSLDPEENVVLLQFRTYTGITEENWEIRLNTALSLAESVYTDLIEKFNLPPLIAPLKADEVTEI